MRHPWRDNLNAALLCLLFPGWGQFEQGRFRIARVQAAWAILALLALAFAPVLPWPRMLPLVDFALVSGWSVLDALLWRGERAAC